MADEETADPNRLIKAWRLEAEANQELVDEASNLLADVEVWANGSTVFPGSLLSALRLFLGPQRCSCCKSGAPCVVHHD